MVLKRWDLRRIGIALLIATCVSITVTLLGMALGLSESTAYGISTVLFFGAFFGLSAVKPRVNTTPSDSR
jgi:hypothetical protein